MITLQEYTFAQLYAESVKSSDIQMSFNVGEVYAKLWTDFIQSFDLRRYDLSNNGIVRSLTIITNDSTVVTVEINHDFLSSSKDLSITFGDKSFQTTYRNLPEFTNALKELRKYYEQNHHSIQRLESK